MQPSLTAETDLTFCLGQIAIRPFRSADAVPLHEATLESIQDLCSWIDGHRPDYALEDCRNFISQSARRMAAGERYSFAIVDRFDRQFLGSVGLSSIDTVHRYANLGYWVRTSWTNRGLAFAAASLAA